MSDRRRFLGIAAAGVLALHAQSSWPQAAAASSEASLRAAIDQYLAAWNSHDVDAWSAMLTDDVWYTEAIDYYQRSKGKSAVLAFHGDTVKTTDIAWEVKKIKQMPDGTATVVIRHVANILPKTEGKYATSFVSDPSVSRWRVVDAKWKMFYFTSHKGSALDVIGKDGVN